MADIFVDPNEDFQSIIDASQAGDVLGFEGLYCMDRPWKFLCGRIYLGNLAYLLRLKSFIGDALIEIIADGEYGRCYVEGFKPLRDNECGEPNDRIEVFRVH